MPETSPLKHILFIALFIVAVFGVFFLAYKKETTHSETEPQPTLTELVPTATEVKAGTISPNTEHMALTSDNIIWYTNYYRAQHHLSPLTLSPKLRDSAYHKSLDMFKYQYFDHYRPSNHLGFDNFIDNQNYSFIKAGENLAMGDFTTSKEIVDAWMKSTTHRQNMLDPAYTEIGVSVDYGMFNNHKSILITQHLGKPTATCPTVNETIKGSIATANKQLTEIKTSIDRQRKTIGETDPDANTYQALIDEYNSFVGIYNTIADQVGDMIKTYNDQAAAFDACIARE